MVNNKMSTTATPYLVDYSLRDAVVGGFQLPKIDINTVTTDSEIGTFEISNSIAAKGEGHGSSMVASTPRW
jgi:hypothetical protein